MTTFDKGDKVLILSVIFVCVFLSGYSWGSSRQNSDIENLCSEEIENYKQWCISEENTVYINTCESDEYLDLPEPALPDGDNWRTISGKASWYGGYFHGRTTASGDTFDKNELTAAMNGVEFGTVAVVTNKANGESVEVVVNDTGGFEKYGRVIDLSEAAFNEIADLGTGIIEVEIHML